MIAANKQSFFLFRVQMSSPDTPAHLYWLGGGLGAVTLASVSAAIMWFIENKMPTVKTLSRDLILGAILFFLLLQLLPESTMSLLTTILTFVTLNTPMMGSPATVYPIEVEEMELRVGVPSF
jgi:hypothetical protein